MVKLSLAPEMTASVEVKTGTRRLVEFLVFPVIKAGDEAISGEVRYSSYLLGFCSFFTFPPRLMGFFVSSRFPSIEGR